MPRANRYFLPGNIWHVTHRCHKKDFLFRFRRNRLCWMHWLYLAKNRYNISVLNYIATRNHIHLLIQDHGGESDIPHFMQLLQSRVAQEYNLLKDRKGAFWEDRYHATAIDTDIYLHQCMIYINMNMVRAGVVQHPIEWQECGFYEIESLKSRYRIIDNHALPRLMGLNNMDEVRISMNESIQDKIKRKEFNRDSKWTESLAVGSEKFVLKIKEQQDLKARNRKILNSDDCFELSETQIPYSAVFDTKNEAIRQKK